MNERLTSQVETCFIFSPFIQHVKYVNMLKFVFSVL
uniref:Uncharacterized protein n=1 Tax=Anguilla anguilla TaxID=7936 RepID=A0A0E9VAT0_ANGAN